MQRTLAVLSFLVLTLACSAAETNTSAQPQPGADPRATAAARKKQAVLAMKVDPQFGVLTNEMQQLRIEFDAQQAREAKLREERAKKLAAPSATGGDGSGEAIEKLQAEMSANRARSQKCNAELLGLARKYGVDLTPKPFSVPAPGSNKGTNAAP